ncbi:MAG: sulfite exporter TauE/SafE family protein [bacterium]|nr:sulfite exporter TauE/SafE family protein [bacterium]
MKKKIYIKGMHCVACEKILEDELIHIPFVKEVKADRKKGEVEIRYGDKEPNTLAIKEMIKKIGYEAFEEKPENNNKEEKTTFMQWLKAVIIVAIILVVFRIFQDAGIVDSINIKDVEASLGISFLVGIVASLSSCLIIVGGVIIAFGEKYKGEGKDFFSRAVKPNLIFHLGRLTTFFVLGGFLGLLGGQINISGNFVAVFSIAIALIMGWLGLNILGIVPSISNLGLGLPKSLTKHWDSLKSSEHKAAPFLLGVSSFFLPCGFTQSMQIFALTSGSFWTGGLSLLLFALGTVPSLLILGITASWSSSRKMVVFQKVAGILVVLFAFFTLQSGLALKGVATNVISTSDTKQTTSSADKKIDDKNMQVVEMHVTSSGFQPAVLKIKKDIPVKWIVKGDQLSGCTNKIIVPSLEISKALVSGDNIINFTPKNTGTIPFSCWMGMVQGKFIVE